MSSLVLDCQFHGHEPSNTKQCGFATTSEDEYREHTKQHAPNVLKVEERLWNLRVLVAKGYAKEGSIKGQKYAELMWRKKPKRMDCGTLGAILQDQGVWDDDAFIGLTAATGGRSL